MKKGILNLVAISLIATSCSTSVKVIGSVSMLSHRNVNTQSEYQLLTSYAGGSPKERKKTRAVTIEDAVDQTVKKVAGGEFLMNAKIYLVKTPRYFKDTEGKKTNLFYFCEGDVWGSKENVSYRGFKVGDKVIVDGVVNTIATIKSLKDDKTCFIMRINGVIEEVKYDRISKAE
jgi:hypothetical protein